MRRLFNARIATAAASTPRVVSVIISTFNWSDPLRWRAVGALAKPENIEVFIVGAACTDDSETVARSFGILGFVGPT
jgi:hypothetical protein